jgi:putative ABC transport system permease protein
MLKNYLQIALRSLLKNTAYTVINITGLAIGLACFILIAMYIRNEVAYDRFFGNSENIYRVNTHVDVNGISNSYPAAHYPACFDMVKDYPEVLKATTMYKAFYLSSVQPRIKYNDLEFEEKKFYIADSTFFEVFDLVFKYGDAKDALKNSYSVVLTDQAAKKYFGDENPVGKIIQFQDTVALKVSGVLQPFRGRTHLDFDFLAQSKLLLNQIVGRNVDHQYVGLWYYSYIVMQPGSSPAGLVSKLPEFVKKYYPPRYTENNAKLTVQKIEDIHLYSDFSTADMSVNGNIQYVYTLGSIGILVLVIACINFMNLSIARFSNRGKEVGVRKVMGADKKNLVVQFLGESIVISLISGIISIVIVTILIPIFNELAETNVEARQLLDPLNVVGIAGIILITGILAGIYPSFVMAAFQPVIVLKGLHKKASSKLDLRKALVIAQFTVSCILLISTFVISEQLTFMRGKNMGFDKEQMIILPVAGSGLFRDYATFKSKLEATTEVVSVTTLSHDLGQKALPYFPMKVEGKEDEQMLPIMYVGHDFAKTFGLEMVQGRSFDIEHRTDSSLAFVINESAARSLGWEDDALGRKITFGVNGNPDSEVIGVVKDFNFDPLRSRVGPLIMGFGFASVNVAIKVRPGDHRNTLDAIGRVWGETITTNKPFAYSFLDEALTDTYRAEEKLAEIFSYFCGLAIFVASLGLFALASFSAERRLKEFGIRKVMGASEPGLVMLMYREFIVLILISFLIASPISWYFSNEWLSNFAYRIDVSPVAYGLSIILITVIALATVGYHSIAAARANPVKVLRSE